MKVRDCFDLNPSGNTNKYTDFINYIDTASVNAGVLNGISYLDEDFPSRAQRLVLQGDILYSSVRPNLRHYYLYNDTFEHAVASTGFVLLRNKSDYNTKFAFYYLTTKEIVKHLSNIAELSQSTYPSFLPKDLGAINLPEIDIAEQEKIVSILSAYDNLIEVNNRRIKVLEQMAENLYKEWFVRFRFPGHETAEFENGMPRGWKIQRLEQFGIILDSGSRPSGGIDITLEEGMPSLGAEVINGLGEFDYNNVKLIPFAYYNQMNRGKNTGRDILIYKDGAYIGKTTIFMNGFPYKHFAVNEHVFLLNAVDSDYQIYLYFTLHLPAYYSLMQNLNRNAAQPGLSRQDINRVKIVVPQIEIVRLFNNVVEPVLNQIFGLATQTQNLIKQRDLLLPRLMSGKLEI